MKKVLLLTTHFFPDPTVAAVRATQWARWLPEFGWSPTVVTRHYGTTVTREQLDEHVHPEVHVHYVGNVRSGWSGGLEKPSLGSRVRRTVSRSPLRAVWVPDIGIRFWNSVQDEICRVVGRVSPEVVITTSPPHSIHQAGFTVTERFPKLRWVADFRDPYRIDPRYQPRGAGRIVSHRHAGFERRIHERADLVTTAIPIHARWARRAFPDRPPPRLLLNGVPERLPEPGQDRTEDSPRRRSVRSVGVAGADEALTLARAVASLVAEGNDLELRFTGPRFETETQILSLLGDRVRFRGDVSHPEALREISDGDVLVALLSQERARTLGLSSKVFEYLAIPVPVLVANPSRSDRRFFHNEEGLALVNGEDENQMKVAIKEGLGYPRTAFLGRSAEVRRRWGRRGQAGSLAQLLASVARLDRDETDHGVTPL